MLEKNHEEGMTELCEDALESVVGGIVANGSKGTASHNYAKLAKKKDTAVKQGEADIKQKQAQLSYDRLAQKMDNWAAQHPNLAKKNNFGGL